MTPPELPALAKLLEDQGYLADEEILLPLHLARTMGRPLLVEGPAGVGKTEIAKVLAAGLGTDLIRLQCYEGLDLHSSVYEWNYQRQLLHLKLEEGGGRTLEERSASIFSEAFLLKRPLLQALTHPRVPVLLIDELDRADEEFESFLLELLGEWQVTIPELGPVRAAHPPQVVITSNRSRDLSDALRRRCFYLWIDYPSYEKELRILRRKVPRIDERLAVQICRFMEALRAEPLEKRPGVAETLDWAQALLLLHRDHLDPETVTRTLGLVLKDWSDLRQTKESLRDFLARLGIRSKLEALGTEDTRPGHAP